jgi:hypothetical protein
MSQSTHLSVHKNYSDDLCFFKVSGVLRPMKHSNCGM